MAAGRLETQDMEVHVEAQVGGQKVLDEDVGHIVVDAFLDVVDVAPERPRGVPLDGRIALLVEEDPHGSLGFVGEVHPHARRGIGVAALLQDLLLPADLHRQLALSVHEIDEGLDPLLRAPGPRGLGARFDGRDIEHEAGTVLGRGQDRGREPLEEGKDVLDAPLRRNHRVAPGLHNRTRRQIAFRITHSETPPSSVFRRGRARPVPQNGSVPRITAR